MIGGISLTNKWNRPTAVQKHIGRQEKMQEEYNMLDACGLLIVLMFVVLGVIFLFKEIVV